MSHTIVLMLITKFQQDLLIRNKDDDVVREGSLGMKLSELCTTGSVFMSVCEQLG